MARKPVKLKKVKSGFLSGATKGSSVRAGSNEGPNIRNQRGKSLTNASGGKRYGTKGQRRDSKGRFA